MDNPEYTFQVLEVFSKIKPKEIPRELEEYISYVARTGDPVFQWSLVKVLIKEKLVAVLNEFKENNPSLEIPPCPNVDPFSYETLKSNLLTRLDSFILPPFTIQRICELLASPRKEYNRIDKYMRAVEKNILVVSACELSLKRGLDTDGNESMMNGMLYDKVNDSMNNFSNHVFSTSHDSNVDDLHLSGKLDVPESDAVQHILDESWTSETGDGDDFKINEANSSSSISVSFENELQFVTDKSTLEKSDTDVDSETKPDERNTSSSFENDSLLMESSLQNIIVDNASVSYDNTLKPTSEESPIEESKIECKDNVMFNFNQSQPEDSTQGILPPVDEQSSTPSTEEKRSFDTSEPQPEASPADSELESNSISAETESLPQTIDKNLPADLEVENQYKSENTFEYENFPAEPTESNSSLEYTFESTSKPEFSDESSTINDETVDHPEKSTSEQQPIETVEKDQPEEQSKLDESLCSGDNEVQKSSTVSSTELKESDPPAHGEPDATEISETNCDDKFEENPLPLEGTSE